MSYTSTELTEIVCTRLSHDLMGSIGAVLGGLELIEEDKGVLDEDIKNILSAGALTLKARQKFFRLVFGTDTQKMTGIELSELCNAYLATVGSRAAPFELKLENISPSLAKISGLCVMAAAEICIKGGVIKVSAAKDNMRVAVSSAYKLSAGKITAYREIISGGKPEENISQYAHLIYLSEFLGKNIPLKISATDTDFELIIG